MSLIVTLSGSPSHPSRSQLLGELVGQRLAADGFTVEGLNVRDLPAEDLLHGRARSTSLQSALALVERADALVVATPVYKAAYSGLLKAFLDLLPQFGLAGKVVLPLATGGTLAHVLAVDYALRPVLASLGAWQVVGGLFVLDKLLERTADGGLRVEAEIDKRLRTAVSDFASAVRRAQRGVIDEALLPAATISLTPATV